MNKSIILLSGGIDSAVTLALEKEKIALALFFNYGQKSFEQEKIAAENLCNYYQIPLKIIDLPWLKEITNTALVNKNEEIPTPEKNNLDDKIASDQTCAKVWVPNRNSVFISVAGAFADSLEFQEIIIGANKEEGATFKDNSPLFVEKSTELLEYSTRVMPKVNAPLINFEKTEIMLLGRKLDLPFKYIRSCYSDRIKHCGECESCKRLKRGLERAGLFDILNLLFDN